MYLRKQFFFPARCSHVRIALSIIHLFILFQLIDKEQSLDGKAVVVVVTGGNISPEELKDIV